MVDWHVQIDGYCERTDFSYWSEPVNAVTNGAFVLAALWMWRRCHGVPAARVLCVILFLIGIGSYLFHTHATQWAALADMAPIGLFILVYLFLVNRDFVGLRPWVAVVATSAFVPYAAVMLPVLNALPFFHISDFYWTVPLLLCAYAAFLFKRHTSTARGMLGGAALLCLSITVRSVDETLCAYWPMGVHFMWHILNACMLAWMIEVYRRHVSRA